jgi:hypothetical protein
MPQELVVYVGPYTAWDSSTRKKIPVIDPETDDIMYYEVLHDVWDQDQRKAKSEDGRAYRICYAPKEDRPGGPKWQFYSVSSRPAGLLVNDLRGIDADAEIEAFATAFAAELKVLEEKLGKPPVLGWGVVRCMG